MHLRLVSLALITCSLPVVAAPDFDPSTDLSGVGVNLNYVVWRDAGYEFADMVRRASFWDGFKPEDADENGYPLKPGRCNFSNMTAVDPPRHLPYATGHYTLTWEGSGNVVVTATSGSCELVSEDLSATVKKRVYNITRWVDDFFVEVTSVGSGADRVRNIHLWMPGYGDGSRQFHDLFLERIRPFSYVRFMNWNVTNDSKQVHWSDRRLPSFYSQSTTIEQWENIPGGVAYEIMVDLCNETRTNGWFCVPHQATDDYMRQMATLIRDRMDPSLKVFIEYSNEVWNGSFRQSNWVKNQNGGDLEGGYGRRCSEMYTIFEDVFGAKPTDQRPGLIKVLGGWANNPAWTEEAFAATTAHRPDVIAVTNYFGKGIAGLISSSFDFSTAAVLSDQNYVTILDEVERCFHLGGRERANISRNAGLASHLGVPLIAYEGGSHIVATSSAQKNNPIYMNFLYNMHAHKRMGDVYRHMLQAWWEEGAHLPDIFTLCQVWATWGTWGHLEYMEQPLSVAHRYREAADYSAKALITHIQTPTLPDAFAGYNYVHTLRAHRDARASSLSWSASGMPPDFWISPRGELLGIPRSAGEHEVTVTVSDDRGTSDSYTFSLTVHQSIVPITVGPLADAVVDDARDDLLGYDNMLSNLLKGRKKAYFKFPLDRFRENVVQTADLVLYGDYDASFSSATDIAIHAVDDNSWLEGQICRTNAPPLGSRITSTTIVKTGTGGHYFPIDITDYIAGKVDAGEDTVSLALVLLTDGNKLAFRSKEYFEVGLEPPHLRVMLSPGEALRARANPTGDVTQGAPCMVHTGRALRVSAPQNTAYTLTLYSLQGQVIGQLHGTGSRTVSLRGENHAAGTYIAHLDHATRRQQLRFTRAD